MKNLINLTVLMISVCILNTACNPAKTTDADHSANEANIRKAYEALSKKDYTTFASLCADDFTELGLAPEPIKGVQASIEQYKVFLDAFPDIKFDITEIVPAGKNKYFLKIHLTGTNTGNFMMLPPTGKSVDVWDMDIVELNDSSKCISHWSANPDGALDQIGYSAINNPNTGVVMAAYDAFGKADIPAILNLCSDDVAFEIHDEMIDAKQSRMYKGKQEVAQFFEDLKSSVTYSKFQPNRFLADGDDVLFFVSAEFKQNSSGNNFSANYNHHFKVVNGKITMFKAVSEKPKKM